MPKKGKFKKFLNDIMSRMGLIDFRCEDRKVTFKITHHGYCEVKYDGYFTVEECENFD
jgi:hypothetical protein